jgi:acetylornithine/N-succinyldiaminopimelate aminotransferase
MAKLIHCSNYYEVPLQEQLAAKLCEISGLTGAFFCSTGPGGQRGALKIARKFGHDKGIERPEIIVYEKAFHGRSIATLSATGNPKVQAGFGPLVEGFVRVPLNDLAAVERWRAATPTWWPCSSRPSRAKAASTRALGLPAGLRALCDRAGLAADARRGAVRHRPHRQVVRAPVGRHPCPT